MRNRVFIIFFIMSFVLIQTKAHPNFIPSKNTWDITDFGAKGDDKTLNTLAIQKTIDACYRSGGGIVRLSSGIYRTGTVFLKNNVQLQIDAGAEIKGSPNRKDYVPIPQKDNLGDLFFLIFAENAEQVSITGNGKINGSGNTFWENEMLSDFVRKPKEWRPSGLIGFVNCRFLTITDAFLTNSPCYTIWALGCDDVKISGITIRNATDGPNTDGIDIDCCRRILITNCNIEGGDDAIAVKSDSGRLGEARACEDIIVSNCILSSPPACAIRVGYEGDSPIRNCIFNNLTIRNSNHGINVISVLPNPTYPCAIFEGTKIENILFNNIIMNGVNQPIYMWMGNEKPDKPFLGYMKDISISNLSATNAGNSFIGSTLDNKNIENIRLSNINLFPGKKISEYSYLNVWGSRHPYVLYTKNVSGIRISDLNVDFSATKDNWQHILFFENIGNAELSSFSAIEATGKVLSSLISTKNSVIKISTYNNADYEHFFGKR